MPKKINDNKNKRVVVAMSGGVDSSVAAYLLKKQGYDVIGIFLKFWSPPASVCSTKKDNLCCDMKALNQARQLAGQLGIPFFVIDVSSQFKKDIVDYFISEYEKGRTPNPCVRCNRTIKFGLLWEKARALGADYLATGHYVRRRGVASGKRLVTRAKRAQSSAEAIELLRSKDASKDQTYFLSQIDPRVIPHLLFPIGDMNKSEVRQIAKKAGIKVHSKKDSVGICFIPDGDTDGFLEHFSKKLRKHGEIVDKKGNILGRHEGLLGYTVGEKIGNDSLAVEYLRVANVSELHPNGSNKRFGKLGGKDIDVPRLYIVAIDTKNNRLVIGENEDCFADHLAIKDFNVISPIFWDLVSKGEAMRFQIRGGHKAVEGHIVKLLNYSLLPV
mgnify:CR=1 FL=1